MSLFDKLEDRAGHSLTIMSGPIAGVSTYYCENCAALFQISNDALVLFHGPRGSRTSEDRCRGLAHGGETLKEKLRKLWDAAVERMKDI